jgi:EPS-associated MarR family transcriptional regulator
VLTDEVRYRLLTLLQDNPQLSQRDVARQMGASLGKVNFCLRALAEKGWIKAQNFTNSGNKSAYMYLLTPEGLRAKARITREFLQVKLREHAELKREIEQIRADAQRQSRRAAKS